jgi:hypothetical protein
MTGLRKQILKNMNFGVTQASQMLCIAQKKGEEKK